MYREIVFATMKRMPRLKRVVQGGGCHDSRAEKWSHHENGDYGCLERFST